MDSKNAKTITIIAWALILVSLYTFVSGMQGAIQDLKTILGEETTSNPILTTSIFFVGAISLLPLIFSVGLLKRKNWGRIGVMIVSVFSIGMSIIYIFSTGTLYPIQMVWVVFYFVVFMTLKNEQYKIEFTQAGSVS